MSFLRSHLAAIPGQFFIPFRPRDKKPDLVFRILDLKGIRGVLEMLGIFRKT